MSEPTAPHTCMDIEPRNCPACRAARTEFVVWREKDGEWAWECHRCAHTGWGLLSKEGASHEADRHWASHV